MDTKQSATNLGLSFGVVNCLVVFSTHFNPNKSPLILLQISHLFRYTPALTRPSANISFMLQATPYSLTNILHKFLGDCWAFWERGCFTCKRIG